MSWFNWGKTSTKEKALPPDPAEDSDVDLNLLADIMLGELNSMEKEPADLPLACARIADAQRSVRQPPMAPAAFMKRANALPDHGQARLALAAAGLTPKVTHACVELGTVVEFVFAFAETHTLLTPVLLLESPLRREEIVRHFLAAAGVTILGETSAESADRLAKLDFKTLMAEAEKAKGSAAERMAYLRKLREEQEARVKPRGKI